MLAALLVPLRSWLGNTNVALVLVVGIVAAARVLGGRAAGVAGSVAAALAYDFFHTLPHYTMTVHARVDRITTVLLLVVASSPARSWCAPNVPAPSPMSARDELACLRRAAHLASASDPGGSRADARSRTGRPPGLWFCRYQRVPLDEPVPPDPPRCDGAGRGWALLTEDPNSWSIELPVTVGERDLGRFLLVPHEPLAAGGFDPTVPGATPSPRPTNSPRALAGHDPG